MNNTSINKIENIVRHLANKMNIKLTKVEISFSPSYEYEVEDGDFDYTDNTYEIDVTLANPDVISQKKAKTFIGRLEYMFYTNKHYRRKNECVFVSFKNFDIEY